MVGAMAGGEPLLRVEGLTTTFWIEDGLVRAVDGVSYELGRGEVLGVVGESGSGKSVGALSLMRLIPSPPGEIAAGRVEFGGRELLALPEAAMRRVRGNEIAMIFQEPLTALNPVFTVGDQIGEPLRLHQGLSAKAARGRAGELLTAVGVPNPERRLDAYPHQLSGGLRQRAMIAMALSCNPTLLIADEPTTALDVSIQAQVINLLQDLQARLGLSYLFISHNLSVVRAICDRVAVMYLGEIVELTSNRALYEEPLHPYTKALLTAVPSVDPGSGATRIVLAGDVPSPINPPPGCRFHTRCPYAMPVCRETPPLLADAGDGHLVACHLYPGSGAEA